MIPNLCIILQLTFIVLFPRILRSQSEKIDLAEGIMVLARTQAISRAGASLATSWTSSLEIREELGRRRLWRGCLMSLKLCELWFFKSLKLCQFWADSHKEFKRLISTIAAIRL